MKTITLTSHEEFLLDLLRVAIDTADPNLANQTKTVLEIAVRHGEGDRAAVWKSLTTVEREQFKQLLSGKRA